jgi:PhnB protein
MTKAIPDGYHAVTPSLSFKDTRKAIDFYRRALDAKELYVAPSPDGKKVMHATIQIGDSILMMADEMPGCVSAETAGGSPITLFLYVQDADKTYNQAVAAGAKPMMPMMDMFWGDRAGNVTDPFGYCWMIATHKRDLSQDEVMKGAEEFFARMAKKS